MKLLQSVYPGTDSRNTARNVLLLSAYGFADGFAAGLLFTLLYRALGGGVAEQALAQSEAS